MTQSVLLAIWAANLRQGGSTKKFKQFKKGITSYVENIDFLLGHNPIRGVNQIMYNGALWPLNYTSQSFSYSGDGSVEVDDSEFLSVVAVTCVVQYSFAIDDYGGQGAQTLTGSFEVPLWDVLENGPDPTDNSATRNFPFVYSWTPPSYGVAGSGTSVQILDNAQLAGKTIKVYYTQLTAAVQVGDADASPVARLASFFEAQLGCGNEYDVTVNGQDLSDQQIIYPQFAGIGSTEIDLGATGSLPQILPEVAFKWGNYPSGDADFADMIEDIFKSGLAQAALASTPNYTQQERGLSSYDLPGAVQKKVGNGAYDRPVTQGNFLVVVATNQGGEIASDAISDTQGNTWTPIFSSGLQYQAWYAIANASGPNTVSIAGLPLGGTGTVSGTPTGWGAPSMGNGSCFGSSFLPWSTYANSTGSGGENGCPLGAGTSTCSSTGISIASIPAGAVIQSIEAYAQGTKIAAGGGTATLTVNYPGGSYTFNLDGTMEAVSLGTDPSAITESTFEFLAHSTDETTDGYSYSCSCSDMGIEVTYGFPDIIQFELAGVDTFDASVTGSTAAESLTTTATAGFAGYVMNIGIGFDEVSQGPVPPSWKTCLPLSNFNAAQNGGAAMSPNVYVQEIGLRSPTTLTIAQPLSGGSAFAALAFKATTPSSFPIPLGDFIDKASFDLTRQQCRAYGLIGSLAMTSQSSGSDWLKSLFQAANAAPVYLGNKLYSIPYAEQSMAGNGAFYTAPTASGPIAELEADYGQAPYGDFTDGGEPEEQTADRIELPNVFQLQIVARENNYNPLVVTQADAATLSLYGMRKQDPVVNNAIQSSSVALMILGIMCRKSQYGGDVYDFTLSPRWMLLSPMDLVTLTDQLANIIGVPVRITSMAEQDDLSMQCQAEPFIYGMCTPAPWSSAPLNPVPAPNPVPTNESAGDVNAPIIFEPVPQLCAEQNQAQIWLVISSPSGVYGGCQVFVSTDGGNSYNAAGNPLMASATTGVLTEDWPAASDPDTTNNLYLDMSESLGVIDTISEQEENNFLYPCIVTGADIQIENDGTAVASLSLPSFANDGTLVCAPSLAWNYELMAYAVATLTGSYQYELMATGSGNELRRAVYNAPDEGTGISHSAGERFAVLNPDGSGIMKINLPSQWIGTELFFKILSFNTFGSALQSLSDVPAYSYTPTGVPYS